MGSARKKSSNIGHKNIMPIIASLPPFLEIFDGVNPLSLRELGKSAKANPA
jgi:hypothetical protein